MRLFRRHAKSDEAPSAEMLQEAWTRERLGDKGDPGNDAYTITDANREKMLFQGWTFACINKIVNKMATCPHMLRNAKQDVVDKHPLLDLLKRPNPLQNGQRLWQTTLLSMEVWGRGFWLIERSGNRPVELWPVPSNSMQLTASENGLPTLWSFITAEGKALPYEARDVVYFHYEAPGSAAAHFAPATAALKQVQADLYAMRYFLDYFKRGTAPQLALIPQHKMQDDERTKLRLELAALYQGIQRWFRPLLLQGGMEVKEISSKPDMGMLKIREQMRQEIFAVFGVLPAVMGIFDNANFGVAIENQHAMFWEDTLQPRLDVVADDVTTQLLAQMDKTGLVYEYNYSAVPALRRSYKEAADTAAKVVSEGVMSPNEARVKFLDLDEDKTHDWMDRPRNPEARTGALPPI